MDNLEFTFVPFAEIHEVEVGQFDQDVSKLSLNVDFLVFQRVLEKFVEEDMIDFRSRLNQL